MNFEDVIAHAYSMKELEDLANLSDAEGFNSDVVKAYKVLMKVADWLAYNTDHYVVGAALNMLADEYDEACGGDDDADA